MKKLTLALALLFPLVAVGISVRIAFNEWIIDYIYAKNDFPKDRYGLSDEYRENLAKLGLKAVLDEEEFEKLRKVKLPDGRKAFNSREEKHMKDVKNFLKKFFPTIYILTFIWFLGLFLSRSPDYLILSGFFSLLLLSLLTILVFTNYYKAFEIFHIIVFDPYSWRFRYTDTLIRIYPMKFWYEATKIVAIISFFLSFLALVIGCLWKLLKRLLHVEM